MTSHVLMQPPGTGETDDRAVLVRDAFSWTGFLVPPVWLLWHRLWIEALVVLAALALLAAIGQVADFRTAGIGLGLLLSIFVGLEGPALRIGALRRRGWREAGVVDAARREDAELRLPDALARAPGRAEVLRPPAPAPGRALAGPALGLFDYPGKN